MRYFIISFFVVVFIGCSSKKNISKSTPTNSTKSKNYEYIKTTLALSEKEMEKPLYKFITEWYGVPYKYGECSKNGVDCSGFVNVLYEKVYNKKLERRSQDIFSKQCQKIKLSDVKEGDLVFFKIESKEISHVGVYLKNNKFVHASTKKGVMISDLTEPYFTKVFYSAGRVK